MSDPKHIADFDEFTRLAQLAEIETLRTTIATQAQRIVELEMQVAGMREQCARHMERAAETLENHPATSPSLKNKASTYRDFAAEIRALPLPTLPSYSVVEELVGALEFIWSQRQQAFAECSVAESIMERAQAALTAYRKLMGRETT